MFRVSDVSVDVDAAACLRRNAWILLSHLFSLTVYAV